MNRIKEIREDKDLLQKDIAKVLNISQRKYSYLETGITALTEESLKKLADYYHTSVDYLLYRTDEKKPYPKSIIK
jgi:transcriptional regulator with XRE-family HTH domain